MRRLASPLLALLACIVSIGGSGAAADLAASPLTASIAVTNPGPLDDCPTQPTPACRTFLYILVRNANPINKGTVPAAPRGRDTVAGGLVVTSVDVYVTINGSTSLIGNFKPPPTGPASFSGLWPMTVRCNPGGACTLGHPAVLPGESVAVFFIGWTHGATEPDGAYVFTLTVHGTLNGSAVSISAHTNAIQMN